MMRRLDTRARPPEWLAVGAHAAGSRIEHLARDAWAALTPMAHNDRRARRRGCGEDDRKDELGGE